VNIDIPKGTRAFSPLETYQIKNIENTISSVFESWGYERINLPTFEYYEVHKKGIGNTLSNKTFRLVDRYEGETLVLRADYTAQIARYVASLKQKEFPIRFYYNGYVYRYVVPKAENLWERRQIGVELIGSEKPEADAEIIAVANKSLKSLGIENFQIDLNNTAIFYALKEILSLSNEEFNEFMEFIKRKEIFNLKKFCQQKKIPESLKQFITGIPTYQGDISLVKALKESLSDYSVLKNAFGFGGLNSFLLLKKARL